MLSAFIFHGLAFCFHNEIPHICITKINLHMAICFYF